MLFEKYYPDVFTRESIAFGYHVAPNALKY